MLLLVANAFLNAAKNAGGDSIIAWKYYLKEYMIFPFAILKYRRCYLTF